MLVILSGCQKNTVRFESPVYPGITFPAEVTVSFLTPKEEGAKALPNLNFHIDNRTMRIWNKTPLPYQSQFDSLNLTMKVTSEAVIRILNEQTQQVTIYDPRKAPNRIDATGGKFRVSIEMEEKPTLNYEMRIMTYGYNPDNFTWTKESAELPVAAVNAKFFTWKDSQYWLATTNFGTSHLYRYANRNFTEITGTTFPEELLPATLTLDSKGMAWVLDSKGALYKSNDLKSWTQHPTDIVVLTQLVGETSKLDGELAFTAIGREAGVYSSFEITETGLENKGNLPSIFPVSEAFVYTYSYSGATSTTLFGGITADGSAAPKSFFLSGSDKWGITPYQVDQQPIPMSGGLFLRTGNDSEIFVIGGSYQGDGESKLIKRSTDRGITWTVLPDQVFRDGVYSGRHHASGFATGNGNQVEIHIFGGVILGHPSREIWHGLLDTTGGIINSWE